MTHFELSHFDEFLAIARQQTEPQTLILLIARRELPDPHTDRQKREFEQGIGGNLTPLALVDRAPDDLSDFHDFTDQARQISGQWDAVFVAALAGHANQPPTTDSIDKATEKVTHAVRNGMVSDLLAFNVQGEPMIINPET